MNEPKAAFKVPTLQRATPLWAALEAHYTERLATLRAQNDAPGMSPERTEFIRGQIAECKAFLQLAQDPPSVT